MLLRVHIMYWYYEFICKCKCTYPVTPYEKCVWIDWDKFVQFKMPKWSQMLHSQNVPVFSKKGKVLYKNQIFIIHYVNWLNAIKGPNDICRVIREVDCFLECLMLDKRWHSSRHTMEEESYTVPVIFCKNVSASEC